MRDYHSHFEPNHFYHIYNRANGNEKLFTEEKNYHFFLDKWEKYIISYADIWAYVLIPNHFHFIIKVKNQPAFPEEAEINRFMEQRFKRLFSSYTLAFNKVYDRTGSLFQKRFKRVKINSEKYLSTLIHYIHHNPIHHNLVTTFEEWQYSSYLAILSQNSTNIYRSNVLEHFGGKEAFQSFHELLKSYKEVDQLILE